MSYEAWVSNRHSLTADGIPYDGEELPKECDDLPMLAGGRIPSWYERHSICCCYFLITLVVSIYI